MTDHTAIQITPYFADGEKYPNIIGVRAEGDEHETAYVRKSDMAEAVDYWRRMYEGDVGTRYSNLFGTPERAARVIVALNNCRVVCCEECAARGACRYDGCGDDYDALLEWLKRSERMAERAREGA